MAEPYIILALSGQEFFLGRCFGVVVIDHGTHASIIAAAKGAMPAAQVECDHIARL